MTEVSKGYGSLPVSTEVPSILTEGVVPIHPGNVIDRLDFDTFHSVWHHSLLTSQWFLMGERGNALELRNPRIEEKQAGDAVYIIDFDDCMMSATYWHKREFELIEDDPYLLDQGIKISNQRAREIYEMSKIIIPAVAEKESRYTPLLNLILLTNFADRLKGGMPEAQAWENLRSWREIVNMHVQLDGEEALNGFDVDPHFREVFLENPPSDFVHTNFLRDFYGGLSNTDTVIVATRGKVEGPLGQIYKLRASGVLEIKSKDFPPESETNSEESQPESWTNPVDLVMYTNDLKADALVSLIKLIPSMRGKLIRILDDNPNEIIPFLNSGREEGIQYEIIQVGHFGAKRRDISAGIDPDVSIRGESEKETNFSHFVALTDKIVY